MAQRYIKPSAYRNHTIADVKLESTFLKQALADTLYVSKTVATISPITIGASKTLATISENAGVVSVAPVNIQIAESQVTNLTSDLSTITGNVTTLQTTVGTLSTNVTNLGTQVTSLSSQVTSMGTEVTTLSASVEAMETTIEDLDTAVDTLETNVSDLSTRMDTAEDDIDDLTARVDNIEIDVPNCITGITLVDTAASITSRVATIPQSSTTVFGLVKVDDALSASSLNPVQNKVVLDLTGELSDITTNAAKSDGTATGDDPTSLAEAINNVGMNAGLIEIVPAAEDSITKYTIKRNGVALAPTIDVPTNLLSLSAKVIDYANPADQHYYTEHSLDVTKRYLMLKFGDDSNLCFINTEDLSLTVDADVVASSTNPTQGGAIYTLVGAANSDISSKIASTISARTSVIAALNEVEVNKPEKISLADEVTEYTSTSQKITLPAATSLIYGVAKLDITPIDNASAAKVNTLVLTAKAVEDSLGWKKVNGKTATVVLADSGSTASANYAVAEGYATTASALYAHAEGNTSTASAEGAHAEGKSTASGKYAHSEGDTTSATANAAHSEGNITIASGVNSHAEGKATEASGESAHAEGDTTTAEGKASHSEGNATKAIVDYSHAEGDTTTASGIASHTEGSNTVTSNLAEHAEGA